MKQTLKLALLSTLAVLSMHAKKDKDSVLDSINRKVNNINKSVEAYIPIRQGNIPYTIPGPGNYRLMENITYTGSGPAITNTQSNVDIDMNGFTINLGGQGLVGISSSGSNVQIYNGSIVNGNLAATVADDLIFYAPSISNPFISPNPSTFNVRTAGISLQNANNVSLVNLHIDSFLYGIASANTVGNIYVLNVDTSNGGNYTVEPNPNPASTPATLLQPLGAGLLVAGSSISPIMNSLGAFNSQPADPTLAGFARNIEVVDCNFGDSETRYGAVFISCSDIDVENCVASSGRVATTPTAATGSPTGVYLTAQAVYTLINSQFAKITNCQATTGTTGVGIYWSKGATATDVNIVDVSHNGIEGLFAYDSYALNCVASRESDSEQYVFSGRGFLALASSDMIFDKCIASNFTLAGTPTAAPPRSAAASPAVPNGYGFVVQASKSCLVNECTAMNNIGGFLEAPNNPATGAVLFPGGSLLLPAGSLGYGALITGTSTDFNAFTKNIAIDNVNSTTEFGTPLNNYNFVSAPWQPVPVSYFPNINSAGAWSNISIPY